MRHANRKTDAGQFPNRPAASWKRQPSAFLVLCMVALAGDLAAQTAVDVPKPEEKAKVERAEKRELEERARRATSIEFRGQQAFTEKQLRSQLKEQIATIDKHGLTAARADDLAFFLEVVY